MPDPTFSLFSWVRRGLAKHISGSPVTNYASLPVSVAINGATFPAPVVHLLGPGDIKSMDARAVIRTDPRDGADNFEPNYLATVEFGPPDFPWLFTPTAPTNDRLHPWICLVVVPDTPGASITTRPDGVAVLRLDSPLDPLAELPELANIDMWAHAQVMGDAPDLSAALDGASPVHLSRLIAPRKLDPGKRYWACLVPTYHAGVNVGLGLPVDDHDLAPAWGQGTTVPLTLPVYYSFRFQTGPGGDFASLAQQIKPADPLKPSLAGARFMYVSDPRFGFTFKPAPGLKVGLEGSLRPLHYQTAQWPDASEAAFKLSLRAALTPQQATDPVVTPPVYGRMQAGKDLPADGQPPNWLRDLNLDPRARAAASAGAEIVKRDQEALVASAWDQLGEIRKANQLLRQAQFARHVTMSLSSRHLATVVDDGAYLQMTAPVHARVRVSLPGSSSAPATATTTPVVPTMRGHIESSRLPPGAVSPALRKLARPRGPVGRQLTPSGGASTLLPRFNLMPSGSLPQPLTAAPPTFKPNGMVTFQEAFPPSHTSPLGPPVATVPRVAALQGEVNFGTALSALGGQLNSAPPPAQVPRPLGGSPTLDLPRQQLSLKLNPEATIRARLAARVPLPADGDPLRPQTATPTFPQPMYTALAELSSEWLFPGISDMPLNTTALLVTNPPFVEAFMIGLNDEMSRELLWREVPVDLRGTYFKNFWGTTKPDIGEIALFDPNAELGKHTADPTAGKLVLLVRADLFRRYPNTLVSAMHAKAKDVLDEANGRTFPIFRGQIGPDVYFFGFDKPDEVDALGATPGNAGWYFLLEEHPTEPRFGLEPAPKQPTSGLPTWNDFAWTQVTLDLKHLSTAVSPPPTPAGEINLAGHTITWGSGAAEMAYILMRKPIRMALHALALIGKD
jgi:hypothetical protein